MYNKLEFCKSFGQPQWLVYSDTEIPDRFNYII